MLGGTNYQDDDTGACLERARPAIEHRADAGAAAAWRPDTLIAFEDGIARDFAAGKINAPIHLSGGNEEDLIGLFRNIQPDDWVLGGWRMHYHCLLKGVPADELRAAIHAGKSVALCFPKHKIFCSGICGGVAPIAVGIAWAFKRRNDDNYMGHETRVWCFLGDMSAEMGIVHEAQKYAARHRLPITWIIEDNGKSVCSDTQETWGDSSPVHDIDRYRYQLTRPHSGIGAWVRF